jgi:DNA mismatch repair protein MutL
MSDIIKLLPDSIANQIAAGEVIQRPASVVKELMENSIDAGATCINLIIKDAGKTLIRVVDNGKGMSENDSKLCFERHATSKIQNADDLFKLQTKGFRGEALASVASIAHVLMSTKTKDNELGIEVEVQGSEIQKSEETSCSKGTSISVKNLFYNVPARRNFLKSENVEIKHIVDEFFRVAMVHPEIEFNFENNGKSYYNLPISNIKQRIVRMMGKSFENKLVPVKEETDIVKISGFIGKPEFARKTRGEQYLFVNNRYFKDHYFNHAIVNAYEGLIEGKLFPSYFIFLEVDPAQIDVNVHPTKTEIKFSEDKFIYSILRSSIKNSIGKFNIAPTIDFNQEVSFNVPHDQKTKPIVQPEVKVNPDYNPFKGSNSGSGGGASNFGNSSMNQVKPNKVDWENFFEESKEETNELVNENATLHEESNFLLIGQLFNSFILIQSDSEFRVLDQSRSHERVLYDEISEKLTSSSIDSQNLIFPIEVEFSQADLMLLKESDLLGKAGFTFEIKEEILEITGVPVYALNQDVKNILDEILDEIKFENKDNHNVLQNIALSLAKNLKIKKGKKLEKAEMNKLVEDLLISSNPNYSPRGKQTIVNFTLDNLSNLFN